MRKFISILLSFSLLVCSMMSMNTFAYAQQSGKYEYDVLDDGTAALCSYLGVVGDIVIPAEIDGYQISRIDLSAFYDHKKIDSVSIPSTVKYIDKSAFYGCSSLKSINVDVQNENYSSEDGVLYNKSKTELLNYPASSFMTAFSVPDSVMKINTSAFANCRNLERIIMSKNIDSIGYNCFYNSISLKEIYYQGSESEWLDLSALNESHLNNITVHYNYDGQCIHEYEMTVDKVPTCSSTGAAIYTCSHCGDTYNQTIPIINHCTETIITKATPYDDGDIVTRCSVCGDTLNSSIIYCPETITISAREYVYNSKVRKPSVTVKNSKGKILANETDYEVSYSNDGKNVGQYTVTVKFKGNYSGNIKKIFRIKPKGTSLSGFTSRIKGFTVKWNKQATQTSGYEIQYATDSKFTKDKKTISIGNNSQTSKTISKLKAKKKYYVRIRTYKTVKVNGKNTKIYSSWSKYKTVKTK